MIPKKIVKITKGMNVETVKPHKAPTFRPISFTAPVKSQSTSIPAKTTSTSRTSTVKPTPTPKPSSRPKGTQNHLYHPLIALLRQLLDNKEQDKKRCTDARLFRIYERRVLNRINALCEELPQLEDAASQLNWVQKTLLPWLGNIAQYYSKICRIAHKSKDTSYQTDIEYWLYNQLSTECEQLGWFRVQRIHPYRDRFQTEEHQQARIVKVENDLHDVILEIRKIGIKEIQSEDIVEKAQVVVGVCID